jgi:hypothetical protein
VLIWWRGAATHCIPRDHDDLVRRALILLQCFIAAVMAANAKESSTRGARVVQLNARLSY